MSWHNFIPADIEQRIRENKITLNDLHVLTQMQIRAWQNTGDLVGYYNGEQALADVLEYLSAIYVDVPAYSEAQRRAMCAA